MNRKPTAERKEEILDAAARIMARDGIASLTIATLAREVGVTTGALFRHFETRDAIGQRIAGSADRGDLALGQRRDIHLSAQQVHVAEFLGAGQARAGAGRRSD